MSGDSIGITREVVRNFENILPRKTQKEDWEFEEFIKKTGFFQR